MNHLVSSLSIAVLSLLSIPAFAGTATPVPEPGTIGLLAGAVAATVIVSRLRKKK